MKIEQNIEIPALAQDGSNGRITGKRRVYPFGDMEIGDSILIEDEGKYKKARSAARSFSDRNSILLEYRITEDGMRIWRTK